MDDDHHHHHASHAGGHSAEDPAAMAEVLELDTEVLHAYAVEVFAWVRHWAPNPTRQILDLGAGTGTGTIALAQRFSDATVTAVDSSAELLDRLVAKAFALGLAERVRAVPVDLDVSWPALAPIDVTWASLSMHHLGNPNAALGRLFGTIRPAGVVAIVEMDQAPRFLPDDLGIGRPGLEQRCHAALRSEQATSMPTLGTDWGPRLAQAGFELLERRTFPLEPPRPYRAATGRYARAFLGRLRGGLADRLGAEDLTTLDLLLADYEPHSLLHRTDLVISGTRTGWIARRP